MHLARQAQRFDLSCANPGGTRLFEQIAKRRPGGIPPVVRILFGPAWLRPADGQRVRRRAAHAAIPVE